MLEPHKAIAWFLPGHWKAWQPAWSSGNLHPQPGTPNTWNKEMTLYLDILLKPLKKCYLPSFEGHLSLKLWCMLSWHVKGCLNLAVMILFTSESWGKASLLRYPAKRWNVQSTAKNLNHCCAKHASNMPSRPNQDGSPSPGLSAFGEVLDASWPG